MAEANEQLIQLIQMIQPMVSTEAGRDSIRKNVFGEHKVAEETVKAMAALRLIDSEVLANALASMVPHSSQPSTSTQPNGAHPPFPPSQPTFGMPPSATSFNPPNPAMPPNPASFPSPSGPYPVPGAGSFPTSGHGYPGVPSPSGMPYGAPPAMPAPQAPPPVMNVPEIIQHLGPEERNMFMAAMTLSQAEVDMLPPPQKAIFMQLRSMGGK